MGDKRTEPEKRRRVGSGREDTASRYLSRSDRKKLNMDAWEPSLLRKLLSAQNRLEKHE